MLKFKNLMLSAAVIVACVCSGCNSENHFSVDSVSNPGEHLTSDGIKGKVTLLDFWATWCGPCKESMPQVQNLYDEYGPKGVLFCGISTESSSKVEDFLTTASETYPMYTDPGSAASSTFAVDSIPRIVIIDKSGRVAYSEVGSPLDVGEIKKTLDNSLAQ